MLLMHCKLSKLYFTVITSIGGNGCCSDSCSGTIYRWQWRMQKFADWEAKTAVGGPKLLLRGGQSDFFCADSSYKLKEILHLREKENLSP